MEKKIVSIVSNVEKHFTKRTIILLLLDMTCCHIPHNTLKGKFFSTHKFLIPSTLLYICNRRRNMHVITNDQEISLHY